MNFRGVYTALVTPFQDSGRGIDENFFRQLIERQIEAKIDGLIISGSTGEGQTLTHEEWKSALKIAMNYSKDIQILGSCGQSGTEQTLERYKFVAELGAAGALVATPAYNKPPQRGLKKHYETIAAAATLPIMVYNIPGRSAVNLLPETLKSLWAQKNIVSIKESSGDLKQIQAVKEGLAEGKTLLSGDDPLNISIWTMGGHGTVSVVSNVIPKAMAMQWKAWSSGQQKEAEKLQKDFEPLIQALFLESNPIPTKWAISRIFGRLCEPRLPLVPLDEAQRPKLQAALDSARELGFL